MDSEIVIEVRGGCLVGVYCTNREQRVMLLDWDELNELRGADRMGGVFAITSFGEMRQDTRSIYDRTVSEYGEGGQ